MIVLIDNMQGTGKSSLCSMLALEDEWFCDDLKNLHADDIYEKLSGHWILELSEMLATNNTKTVEDTKAFISRRIDTYRPKYAKYPVDFPRQCIFIGTSNNIECLPSDETGNRRFFPIRCYKNRALVHPLENTNFTHNFIEQLWAQAYYIYCNEDFSLDIDKGIAAELDEMRKAYTPSDSWVGEIEYWLDKNAQVTKVCPRMLWDEALNNSDKEMKRGDSNRISKIMDNSIPNWTRSATPGGKLSFERYGQQKAWIRLTEDEWKQSEKTPGNPFSE